MSYPSYSPSSRLIRPSPFIAAGLDLGKPFTDLRILHRIKGPPRQPHRNTEVRTRCIWVPGPHLRRVDRGNDPGSLKAGENVALGSTFDRWPFDSFETTLASQSSLKSSTLSRLPVTRTPFTLSLSHTPASPSQPPPPTCYNQHSPPTNQHEAEPQTIFSCATVLVRRTSSWSTRGMACVYTTSGWREVPLSC